MATNEFRFFYLPYCIERVSPGKYVILNRKYKPLGITEGDHVDYMPWAVSMKLTAQTAAKLSWKGDPSLEKIWLYHDGSIPTRSAAHMTAYLERLAILAKLKVERKSK
jgi:hypothetical protein